MNIRDENWALTTPDMSITITRDEAMEALHLFEFIHWDHIEAAIGPDMKDTSGKRCDRHNRNIRLAVLAEGLTMVRNAKPGAGIDLMSNPYYERMVETLLDLFDEVKAAERAALS